jgi:hypothetical protein
MGKPVGRHRSDLQPTTEKNVFARQRADAASLAGSVQFLKNDRKVLHFRALWEDRTYLGETREFVLNYFLADDTVEVLEEQKENSGRDPFPALLKRMKLPKQPAASVLAPSNQPKEFYGPADLRCGSTVSVFSRKLLLFDCDQVPPPRTRSSQGGYRGRAHIRMETLRLRSTAARAPWACELILLA